jgi:hypothetical protein
MDSTYIARHKARGSNILAGHCELQQWSHALTRLGLHPHEVTTKMPGGKLPLHIACSNGSPAVFVLALSSSFPAALCMTDDDGMTPLHCACSCPDVALDTLEALLRWSNSRGGKEMITQDSDGDTPLHSACRVMTSQQVLKRLVKANPEALKVIDKEGLTPLLRLWVRPSVLFGRAQLEAIRSKSELTGELADLWEKTMIFLEAMSDPSEPFRVLHTIIANDCPRSVLKIAMKLYPEERDKLNLFGDSTLSLAISAPTFKVRELTDESLCFGGDGTDGGAGEGDGEDPNAVKGLNGKMRIVPSVIKTLLEHEASRKKSMLSMFNFAAVHRALKVGKGWTDGIDSLAAADPDTIQKRDDETRMYPFMLAASCCKTKATHTETIFQLLRLRPEFVELGLPTNAPAESLLSSNSTRKRKPIKPDETSKDCRERHSKVSRKGDSANGALEDANP